MGSTRQISQLMVAISITWLGGVTALAESPRANGTVTGRVVDEVGRPVSGAKIQFEESKGERHPLFATTGEDGRFTFADLPPSVRMFVIVDAPECGREFRNGLDIYSGAVTDIGDIPVYPGGVYRGRVVDADGKPAAGVELEAQMYLHELGHTISHVGPAWTLKTDADGRYATPPLPACYINVGIKNAGNRVTDDWPIAYILPGKKEMTGEDIHLVPELPITGTVSDIFGNPVVGANVWSSPGRGEDVKTDAVGRFTIHGVSAKGLADTRLYFEARGFASFNDQDPVAQTTRKIVLKPCGYISGRVVDVDTGEPVKISKLIVCEVRRDADGTPHSYGCGEVRFDQPQPGEFRAEVSLTGDKHLTVMADGYERGEDYVFGFDLGKEAKDIALKMKRSGSSSTAARQRLYGVVTRDGRPAANVWVSLWQVKEEWDPVNAWMDRGRTVDGTYRPSWIDVLTDDAGSYSLDVADPGQFYVVAQPKDGTRAISPQIKIAADQAQSCDLAITTGGTIRGHIAGVQPEVARQLWVVAFGHTPFRTAVPVDSMGNFVVTNIPSGEIGLKVGHEGHIDTDVLRFPFPKGAREKKSEPWTRAVKVTLAAGESRDGIELELPTPGEPDHRD